VTSPHTPPLAPLAENGPDASLAEHMKPAKKSFFAQFRPSNPKMRALRARFVWFSLTNQGLLGLAMVYLAIRYAEAYLHGWSLAFAPFFFATGLFNGWYANRNLQVEWNEEGGSFPLASLGKSFLFLLPIFLLRFVLGYLTRHGILNAAPFMRMMLFFVPGVFMARFTTLLTKVIRRRREFISRKQGEVASPVVP